MIALIMLTPRPPVQFAHVQTLAAQASEASTSVGGRLAGNSHHHYLEDWDWSTANLRVVFITEIGNDQSQCRSTVI